MAASELRYDPERIAFVIGDEPVVEIARDDAIVARAEALADVSLASFESALTAYEEDDAASTPWIFLADVPADEFDPDTAPRQIWLSFLGGDLTVQVWSSLDEHGDSAADVPTLLAPLLHRHGADSRGDYRDDQAGHLSRVYLLGIVGEGRTVGELHRLGVEAQALLYASSGDGKPNAVTARDLIASGHASALLGQPESNWIDAKAVPHRTDSEAASFELAKDVAAFANTGRDAIIVYGITTAKDPSGGDVLDALRPFKVSSVDLPALRSALADRLTPLLTDVEIDVVEVRAGSGYGLGWVFIPSQASYIRPVLVRGVLVGDKVIGTHVSAPFRVGEDTRHLDASTLHSLIQAGRVALDRSGEPAHADGTDGRDQQIAQGTPPSADGVRAS